MVDNPLDLEFMTGVVVVWDDAFESLEPFGIMIRVVVVVVDQINENVLPISAYVYFKHRSR